MRIRDLGWRQWAGTRASGPVGGDRGLTAALPSLQEAEAIIQKIKQQQYTDLLAHDQLLTERKEQKVFLHFGEHCRPFPWGPLQLSFCLPLSRHPHGGRGRDYAWRLRDLVQM